MGDNPAMENDVGNADPLPVKSDNGVERYSDIKVLEIDQHGTKDDLEGSETSFGKPSSKQIWMAVFGKIS